MKSGEWQLPVIERKAINELYISNNAKYHYYVDNGIESEHLGVMNPKKSLCRRHTQCTEEFESIESEQIIKNTTIACKVCYKKWLKGNL